MTTSSRKLSQAKRLMKFAAVGGFCLLLQLFVLKLAKSHGSSPFAADAIGFFSSAQINFVLSYQFTWRDTARLRGQALLRKYLTFIGAASLSTIINASVFAAVQPSTNDLMGVVFAGFTSMGFTFLMNHFVVFRGSRRPVAQVRERVGFDSIAWFLPAYSEAANLQEFVPEIVSFLRSLGWPFSLTIVNDGSPDNTAEVSEELASRYSEVQVKHHAVNLGYSAALRTGLAAGLETGHSLIGFCDADHQFRIDSLVPMLQEIEEADLVLGFRIKRADGFKRYLMGRGWHHLNCLLLDYRTRDTDCGFKLFRREVVESLLPRLSGEYATISPELIARAQHQGFATSQVGVEHYPRPTGKQSGASLRVIVGSFKCLLKTRQTIRKEVRDAGARH